MAAITSSWLVGSLRLASNATITVGGVPVVIAAGSYYLRDATAGLSLIDALETAIASQVAGSTVRVLKNRRVRIDFSGNSTALVIPTVLQEALGFTSSPYAGATSRTSEAIPGLLWSPGWGGTTQGAPVGSLGYRDHDRVVRTSPSGLTTTVTTHHYRTRQRLSWSAVRQDRAFTPAELPGEFVDFRERVLIPGRQLKHYTVLEDDADATPITWTTGLGPYIAPELPADWYQRFVAVSDSLGANIELELQVTGEYS